MRGISGGKGDVTAGSRKRVNRTVQPSYQLSQSASHTLQNRDCERTETLRSRAIDVTVEAIASSSHPRLAPSRP
jgi:hypothetical protein